MMKRAVTLSHKNEISKAINITKKLLISYPQDDKLLQLHAKLLFWSGDADQAKKYILKSLDRTSKIYTQISTSSTTKKLKTLPSAKEKLVYINKLKDFSKNEYEVLWIKLRAEVETGNIKNALYTAEYLDEKYPNDQEIQAYLAKLLFWDKQYIKSLHLYESLQKKYGKQYNNKVTQLNNIVYGKLQKKTLTYNEKKVQKINTLLTKGEKYNARYIFDTLDTKTQTYYNNNYTDNSCKLLMQSMVGIGIHRASYSDKRYKDETNYLEFTLPLNPYTLYGRVNKTKRYNLEDTKISLDFYPVLPQPFWGYLAVSLTPDADFFSKYSIGWHQYYGINNWEFKLGYVWNQYKMDSIHTLIGEYSYNFADNIFAKQTFYFVPDNNSWAIVNKIKYQSSCHTELSLTYTKSHSNEPIEDPTLFMSLDNNKIEAAGEYSFHKKNSIGFNLGFESINGDNHEYQRKHIEIFLRHYW